MNNYNAGRTTLCRPDLEAIRDWSREANFNFENAGFATEAGVVAMHNIARRFQQVFPDILTDTYDANRFHFRHTDAERTNTSIRAFATGLFGTAASNVVYQDVPERDWFLRPFDFCPAYRDAVDGIWDIEREAFRHGPEFEEMLREINRKLGFQESNPVSFETTYIMWQWCRYETAAKFELSDSETGGDSVWCAPFSVAHQMLFEYYDELGYYYSMGYGVRNQRLIENMNCGVMQDLLNLIVSEGDDPVARIFVTSIKEIQSMLVVLGLFRDTWPLHQHNYAQQSGRGWVTSVISPHASNLAVIRYE